MKLQNIPFGVILGHIPRQSGYSWHYWYSVATQSSHQNFSWFSLSFTNHRI